ncbi:hypothetical protein [Novosphingobium barchaimii]|uniref:hypothetical protein n=1 Tax=Novosphingobium barchaimii TaxID=1420591 RepID=UPI000740DC92|nr:hypothetical protein [Novosphingobium barchaimii]
MLELSWSSILWAIKDEVQFAAYLVLFLYSMVRGAAPERLLSGVLFAMLAFDKIHHALLGGSILWHHANLGHFVIDLLVMACTFVIALHANRVYPLWVAGVEIISVFGHIYRLGLEEINRFAYDMMVVMPSYIQLVAMTLGILFHTSRRRRLGSYPSWRHSWRPMPPAGASISPTF